MTSRALATKSLGEFTIFAQQNSKDFTGDVLASVSRHISQLVNGRERLVYDDAKELIKIIEAVDLSSLSLRSTSPYTQTPTTSSPFYAASRLAATTPPSSIPSGPLSPPKSSLWCRHVNKPNRISATWLTPTPSLHSSASRRLDRSLRDCSNCWRLPASRAGQGSMIRRSASSSGGYRSGHS